MTKKPVTFIQEKEKYLEIEFWNPIHESSKFYVLLLITLFFTLIALAGIQNIGHIDWILTAIFLIGLPLFLTISQYTANNYPWVLIIDVKNNKIRCSGYLIRTISHEYNLSDLERIDINQYSEKESLKELVSYKPKAVLFVKAVHFRIGKRDLSILKIATTVEEWVNVFKKIDYLLKTNNYTISIPEIQ